jgi:hypothetical protein
LFTIARNVATDDYRRRRTVLDALRERARHSDVEEVASAAPNAPRLGALLAAAAARHATAGAQIRRGPDQSRHRRADRFGVSQTSQRSCTARSSPARPLGCAEVTMDEPHDDFWTVCAATRGGVQP